MDNNEKVEQPVSNSLRAVIGKAKSSAVGLVGVAAPATESRPLARDGQLIPGQWEYISCHCLVKTGTSGVTFTYDCDMCRNTNLRFIHTLEHREDMSQIWVGIECAGRLMNGSKIPALAENETKRKERWRIKDRRPERVI